MLPAPKAETPKECGPARVSALGRERIFVFLRSPIGVVEIGLSSCVTVLAPAQFAVAGSLQQRVASPGTKADLV